MLKLAGSGLILAAGILFGLQLRWQLWEHLQQLLGLKELLQLLAGELSYIRTPLPDTFVRLSQHTRDPYDELLRELARRMEESRDLELREHWQQVLDSEGTKLLLNGQEQEILRDFGYNLGYLDIEMQVKQIAMYIQQVDERIFRAQKELAEKQKLYQYLSVMGGLFLILILI